MKKASIITIVLLAVLTAVFAILYINGNNEKSILSGEKDELTERTARLTEAYRYR